MHWRELQAWLIDATNEGEEDPDEPSWKRNLNDGKPPQIPAYVRDALPTLDADG